MISVSLLRVPKVLPLAFKSYSLEQCESVPPVVYTRQASNVMFSCSAFVTVPIGCALFPQRMSIATNKLEKSVQDQIRSNSASVPDRVYFNKGL